jgi:fructokinase
MTDRRIIAMGEVLWDLFPTGPRFGGAPANFACHAALLGGSVALISAVGNDARGREAVTILNRYAIDTSLIQSIGDRPTGAVGVELDPSGKPRFEIHSGSAWDVIAWTPPIETAVSGAEAVYFGTLAQRGDVSRATVQHALEIARAHGLRRVLDVNLRPPFIDPDLIRRSLELATVLKLSDDELDEVLSACGIRAGFSIASTLQSLGSQFGLELVAMTRGAEGALLVSQREVVDQPGIPTVVRDTVGAGDAFTAALLIGLLAGTPLVDVARSACERAAAVCAHDGAVPEPAVQG